MPDFFVDINLHSASSDKFMRLIPSQRAIVNELMLDGKICSYSVSINRHKLWIIVNAKNEDEVFDVLSKFPLLQFMDIEVFPLLFHNTPQQVYSQISLN